MKIFSISLVTIEMPMKITVKHQLIPTGMATIKRQAITSVDKDGEKLEFSLIADRNVKQCSHFGK